MRRVERISRSCERCGATFQVLPRAVTRGRGRFCSRRCVGDPERVREWNARIWTDPDAVARRNENTRRLWKDPRHREMRLEAVRAGKASDAAQRRISDGAARSWTGAGVREKRSASIREALAKPAILALRSGARWSVVRKRAWARKAVREARLPLLREHVERARELLDASEPFEVVVDALVQEART